MKWILVVTLVVNSASAGILPRTSGAKKKTEKAVQPSLLDQYLESAKSQPEVGASPGAIWTASSRLPEFVRDPRASQINDIVTVLVTESVSAVATGASKSSRSSAADASVTSLAGPKPPASSLANLLKLSGDQKLDGAGTTSRAATLTATVSARVVAVLPGGMLLIEGEKNIQVNSEQQTILLRGVIRTFDISKVNTISSTQVADMEIRVNGKGIVGDAVRRPNLLYRLVMGLLPF